MNRWMRWMVAGWLLAVPAVWAQKVEDDPAAISNKVMKFISGIQYRQGTIELGKGLATLNVPETFRYVGPDDAAKILLLWGNPPDEDKPLGMLFPAGMNPVSEGTWAVVIEWSGDGYVKDDDAAKIDYTKMLKDMQASCREESKEREKEGYNAIDLVGWATPPRYDAATHKMYWAKEIKFGGEPENTLNYNIRMLGRSGVLVLNAVSSMSQLKNIEQATPQLLAMVEFKQGQRYADFDPSSDKYAGYGLAALVAGGVAAKAGLFKGLIALLIAGKKVIVVGVVGLVALVKKFFGRKAA